MGLEEAIKLKQKSSGKDEIDPSLLLEKNPEISQLKNLIRERVIHEYKDDKDLLQDNDGLKAVIRKLLEEEYELSYSHLLLSSAERRMIVENIVQQIVGFGVIDPLIKDHSVTEIMVNGINKIFIEKNAQIQIAKTENGKRLVFSSEKELLNVIEKIVAPINRKIDETQPIVDARLPDGSRVNAVIRPVSLEGPVVTIRKFPEQPFTPDELVSFGTLSSDVMQMLKKMIQARYNIVISGGTGSGKTTFLNALSMCIPQNERVITVEDAAELKVTHIENLIRMETRPSNVEGKGEISMRDLVKTSLRMRPDRIVVGEVRGGEALDMLQAMNTGHDGSLTTGHSNSAQDMLSRLETMVLMSGLELPLPAIRRQIASAVEFIVHVGRLRDGTRRVLQISEVVDLQDQEIECNDIFRWKMEGTTEEDRRIGALHPIGTKIKQVEKWKSLHSEPLTIDGIPLMEE